MSSKTVKRHPYVKRERPRDGGSYQRDSEGKLTRIPDPVDEPAKGVAAVLPPTTSKTPKASDAPVSVPPRIAAD